MELEDPTHTPSHKRDNTPPNNNTHINTQHKHHTPPTTPPPRQKDGLVEPLFPVEAKPPTPRPCSCKNRLVVRALVEWMNWMVGEETGLPSPRRLRRPAARCCATAAKVWVRLAHHNLGVCALRPWLCPTTYPPPHIAHNNDNSDGPMCIES